MQHTKTKNFISSVWDFKKYGITDTNYATHNIFRWYGKLVPQLVRKGILLYSNENDTILANFCGSGTILLEAILNKRHAIGTDTNPLAILVSKVKTTPLHSEEIPNVADNIIKKSNAIYKRLNPESILKWDKWYSKENIQKLIALKKYCDEISDRKLRNFFLIALASVVRNTSRIDARCVNHIVVDKNKNTVDPLLEFKKKIQQMTSSVNSFIESYNKNGHFTCKIKTASASKLNFLEDNSIDMVFSHPPYLGAINYHNIYRLSTDLLGYANSEIADNDFSSESEKKYLSNMTNSFSEMYRVLKPNKYALIVIGDTRRKGQIIPTSSNFIFLLKKQGFELIDIFIWIQSQKAGMNVARRGHHIDHNFILIVKKPTGG